MRKKVYNEIMTLQKRLRPLTAAQVSYAHSHYSKVAYYNSRHLQWCQVCGAAEQSNPEFIRLDAELGGQCSHCKAKITLERKIGKCFSEMRYITYATHIAGWQVFRTFLAERYNKRGQSTAYSLNEVYQHWIDAEGKEYILSVGYTRIAWSGERWYFQTPLDKPRKHNAVYTGQYYFPDMFDIAGNFVYPRSSYSPMLRRNGWSNSFLSDAWLSVAEVCKALLSSRKMETVAKTQPKLFTWVVKNDVEEYYYHAVKVCNRKGYIIDEPDLWLDYLADLTRLGLDTHNSYYVCPADVAEAHEATQQRLYRLRKKEEAEELRKNICKLEEAYSKHIAPYIDLVLRRGDIVIIPLRTVQDVYDEGRAMHHCVFENEYYKKPNTLLLSARDKEGNRIETVEVNTKSLQVLQSRGQYNKNTEHHNCIIELINSNMDKIRKAV